MFTRLKIAGTWACWHVPLHSNIHNNSAHRFMLTRETLVRGTYRVCAPGKSPAALSSMECLEQKGWAGMRLWSLFSCALQVSSRSWRFLFSLWLWSLLLAPWQLPQTLFSLSQSRSLALPANVSPFSAYSNVGFIWMVTSRNSFTLRTFPCGILPMYLGPQDYSLLRAQDPMCKVLYKNKKYRDLLPYGQCYLSFTFSMLALCSAFSAVSSCPSYY